MRISHAFGIRCAPSIPNRPDRASHSRGRHPRLRRGHRPSAARRGIGPSPPGGRAVSRPTRPWCAVTASLVAYPVGKSHRLKPRPRPPSRIAVSCGQYRSKKSHESNAYNFTTSIGIPRTTCKFDEYEGSPAHRRRAPARHPRVRALARPCLGPVAVAHLPEHADAPSRPACRQLPPRREGRGRGVHERGIACTIAGEAAAGPGAAFDPSLPDEFVARPFGRVSASRAITLGAGGA